MKKVAALLAFSTVVAFGATAKAADIAPPPEVYDWTGFYIGGNVGGGFAGDDRVGLQSTDPDGIFDGNIRNLDKLQLNGFNGGGQIGADWQTGSFVFGAIADIQGSTLFDKITNTGPLNGNDGKVHASDDIDVWGTVRGRAGWAFDRVLVYGTGGLAWADIDYVFRGRNFDTGENFSSEDHSVRAGWTAGGGIAWAIDDRWSIGAEYLYVNFGKYNVKANVLDADGDPTGEHVKTEATPDFHSIKGFVNFKF